jgi:hypothetical protein
MADKNYNKIQITNLLNNKFYFKNQKNHRNNQSNSIAFSTYKHKIFYPNKKRIHLVENLKPCNELRKEKEVLMKQNYINKTLKSFFQVINKNSKKNSKTNTNTNTNNNTNNKNEKEPVNNLNFHNYISKTNRHQRNNSNQYEYLKTHINTNIFKTYTFYKNKDLLNEDDNNYKKMGKTVSGSHKFKALSSPMKQFNLKQMSIVKRPKNLKIFNNDIISNHFKILKEKKNKENKKEIKCLNIREIVNKNRINNLLISCDNNKLNNHNKKETKQFTFTVNKNSKKYPYSLRIIKRGQVFKNFLNDYNAKTEYRKNNLKELNSVSYKPFNLLRKNAFLNQL